VTVPEHQRADHRPYIAAVRRGIESRDIRVTSVSLTSAGGRREATLVLRPDELAYAWRVPGEATACWDEADGWSMLVCDGQLANRVRKGLGVLPDPEDVAVWAVAVLAHPELTPSYEDHPFRDHRLPDPGFEAQLARYAPGA
jgi:hypothetical protein